MDSRQQGNLNPNANSNVPYTPSYMNMNPNMNTNANGSRVYSNSGTTTNNAGLPPTSYHPPSSGTTPNMSMSMNMNMNRAPSTNPNFNPNLGRRNGGSAGGNSAMNLNNRGTTNINIPHSYVSPTSLNSSSSNTNVSSNRNCNLNLSNSSNVGVHGGVTPYNKYPNNNLPSINNTTNHHPQQQQQQQQQIYQMNAPSSSSVRTNTSNTSARHMQPNTVNVKNPNQMTSHYTNNNYVGTNIKSNHIMTNNNNLNTSAMRPSPTAGSAGIIDNTIPSSNTNMTYNHKTNIYKPNTNINASSNGGTMMRIGPNVTKTTTIAATSSSINSTNTITTNTNIQNDSKSNIVTTKTITSTTMNSNNSKPASSSNTVVKPTATSTDIQYLSELRRSYRSLASSIIVAFRHAEHISKRNKLSSSSQQTNQNLQQQRQKLQEKIKVALTNRNNFQKMLRTLELRELNLEADRKVLQEYQKSTPSCFDSKSLLSTDMQEMYQPRKRVLSSVERFEKRLTKRKREANVITID